MNVPLVGRFAFRRAEFWADGVIHILGIALGWGPSRH